MKKPAVAIKIFSYLAIAFVALSFLVIFPNPNLAHAQAGGCSIQAYWDASGKQVTSDATVPPGSYIARAVFNNCIANTNNGFTTNTGYIYLCPNHQCEDARHTFSAQQDIVNPGQVLSSKPISMQNGTVYQFKAQLWHGPTLITEQYSSTLTVTNPSNVPGDPNASCQAQAYWQAPNGGALIPKTTSTFPPGTYQATATLSSCAGNVYIIACPNPDGSAGCSGPLAQTTVSGGSKTISTQISIKDGGQYYFDVKLDTQDASGKTLATSPQITGKTDAANPVAPVAPVTTPINPGATVGTPTQYASNPAGCAPGTGTATELCNPIKATSILNLGFLIMQYILAGVAALAFVFSVLGAFQLTVSRGNPEALTKAKDTILWSIAGVVVALLAFSVIAIIRNAFGAF